MHFKFVKLHRAIELVSLSGPYRQEKILYYPFDSDINLHTYVKLKIKWGNHQELFFHFLHRKRVIHRKRKKGGPR